jgi:hypothetical protein
MILGFGESCLWDGAPLCPCAPAPSAEKSREWVIGHERSTCYNEHLSLCLSPGVFSAQRRRGTLRGENSREQRIEPDGMVSRDHPLST